MNHARETLKQLKKADRFVRLSFRKNGPKSFKRGQGALLNTLLSNDGATQRELVDLMNVSRGDLKDIVKKAERNNYVTIENADAKRTYRVKLTDEGREVAQKRADAHDKAAEEILSCLTEEEIAQLNSITEKIILSAKDRGIKGKKKGCKGRGQGHGHGCDRARDGRKCRCHHGGRGHGGHGGHHGCECHAHGGHHGHGGHGHGHGGDHDGHCCHHHRHHRH